METVWTIIASVLASTGLAAAVMKYVVESALKEAQHRKKIEQERREERYKLEDEWQHNVGRVLFWIHHGIKRHERNEPKEYWNGELKKSMEEMLETEHKKKKLRPHTACRGK